MSETSEFYAAVDRSFQAGETVAVGSVVRTRGSTPRRVGARMLIRADGSTRGTIGGGCGEAEVWRTGLQVIADGEPRRVIVDLTQDISMLSEGVCGGILEVLVEAWSPTPGPEATNWLARPTGEPIELVGALRAHLAVQEPVLVATVVERTDGGTPQLARVLLPPDGEPVGDLAWPALQRQVVRDAPDLLQTGASETREYNLEDGRAAVFFDVLQPQPMLIVVGAGHIAVPLARVGSLLDFTVVVLDDRPALADPARFPTADRVIADDFEAALDSLPMTPSTYVVLVTRGHTHDVRSLRRLLGRPTGYVGMIGSRRRVFAVFKLLHDEGVAIEDLLRVHAPIGLDLEAETPAEIAVSIGAELMKVRRGGRAASLSDRSRAEYLYSLTHSSGGSAAEPASPAGRSLGVAVGAGGGSSFVPENV